MPSDPRSIVGLVRQTAAAKAAQHHDEERDALVMEALRIGERLAVADGCLKAWTPPDACDCGPCVRLATVRAALKAMGK